MAVTKKKLVDDPVKFQGEKDIKENFVPIDERDIARALDVPVKEKKEFTIEKMENVKQKNKKTKKLTTKESNGKNKYWTEEFKIPGPKVLKKSGHMMIITEKPQAALKLANALAINGIKKNTVGGVSYYTIYRDEREINVVCAVGHLFTLAQIHPRNKWPTFEITWAPNYLVRKKDFTKKYYDTIAKLCKNTSEIVVATDYDTEGEVIGMNIVKYICNQKDAERMKFSTLTAEDIQKAFNERSKTLDWNQGIAGETRHYIDWIYGINLSRALMDAIKSAGNFRLMSIGRVQGPALNLIVKKEHEIGKFKPEKYWQVLLDITNKKEKAEVKYVKDIKKEKELEKFKELNGKTGIAKTTTSERKIQPQPPFDLTALQTEAYRWFKITPAKTLEIAQKLYLAGIISYPRTNSQKIPKEIGYPKLLKRLEERFNFAKFAKRTIPIEGRKTDPAHPSIYPTGEFHELEDEDRKIYELIVKRFIGCFCEDAVLSNKKIDFQTEGLKFDAKGSEIIKKGWLDVYPSSYEEHIIPDINGEAEILKVKIEEKETQPPKRYSPASIISELERKNLGTKATRASILETLYNRGYIKDKSLKATSLGISLIETLEKNCPIIIDESLTTNMERDLDSIRSSKKPEEKEKQILEETKKVVVKIGEHFEKNKLDIGKDLIKATTELWEEQKKENEIMICPVCNKGKLIIKYNRASRRYFIACDSYPECKTTYSLPPNSLIKKTDKVCEYCSWPMLMSIKSGKKPWIFCFNNECSGKNKEN
ncbi:MAG: DNA topoisomerase I [Candidatus Pacearchaeota archaeon]